MAKSLSGKVLSSIYRSPDHPTLFFHFKDGSAYQVLVAGYDPTSHRPSPSTSTSSGFGSIQKKLELDPFLESLAQPGQTTVINLKIVHSALIRLADKAFERRSSVSNAAPPSPHKLTRTFTSSSSTSSGSQGRGDTDDGDETERGARTPPTPPPTYSEQKWNQHHMSLALKFEGVEGWHCISASMQSRSNGTSSYPSSLFGNWSFTSTSTASSPTSASVPSSSSTNLALGSPCFLSPPAEVNGEVFRSYEDVYVSRVQNHNNNNNAGGVNSPVKRKQGHVRKNSEWSDWSFSSG